MLGALDTLQTGKRLKEAGFDDAQAEAMTEVLRESREGTIADLATKADLEKLGNATKADIAALKVELVKFAAETKAEFAAVRSEMVLLRQELEGRIGGVEATLEILGRDMTIRLGSMLVVMTGTLLAAKFFG
jgi:hypothetical protein